MSPSASRSLTLPPLKPKPRHALTPWQASFARWFAETHRPSVDDQVRIATTLANEFRRDGEPDITLTYDQLKWLRRRRDFQDLVEALRAGGIVAAQAYLTAKYPRLAELHVWGAEEARRQSDYRAMAQFTVPAMDRYAPKKDPMVGVAQQIVIQMTQRQIECLETPSVAVVAEAMDTSAEELAEPKRSPRNGLVGGHSG